MAVNRISDQVYSVGVLNPSLRVFDIVMEAKYGTSYNAYLITDQKTVLVDTVHLDYFDEYLNNIGQLADIGAIDYLVMNHTELDHSGSVLKLLELSPNMTVVCTAAAKKYLTAITNREFKCMVIRDGAELEIGAHKLKFVVAPMLHWPDSMMTYHEDDKVLLSCDFLGCHFCEPQVFDTCIKYPQAYREQFAYYYQGIFGPFKPYVLAGLDKIKDLELKAICPSHGPVLTETMKERMDDYRAWSTPQEKQEKSAAVLYASAYGCTRQLAEKAYDTLCICGIKTQLIDMVTTPVAQSAAAVQEADLVMIGSTTINKDAPKVVWEVLSSIDAINVKNKPAAAFGSYGWSGEASIMINQRLQQLHFNVPDEPVRANFTPDQYNLDTIAQAARDLYDKVTCKACQK